MHYTFNDFTLDTDRFELCRGGRALEVEPQVIELLALLVANAGRMVSREEIINRVWRGRVVSDAAVSSRIKSARQALGDSGRSQAMIRTVHGKGFRFVAEVQCGAPDESVAGIRAEEEPDGSPAAAPTGGRDPARPAVAVLPFANISSDAEQEYFSDGITTDLITHLARHRWLALTARNTSFGYKGRALDVREIGRELGVDYIVEGSVQRAGDRVRINAVLIDAGSGHQVWAERFDREIADIFALQDEITEKIAARIEPEIGYAERTRVVRSRPASLKAWHCFHLGVHHFYRFTADDNVEAQKLLKRAQDLDPGFGDAYAWWAYAVVLGMVYWDTPPTDGLLDRALAACNKALSLDGQNAVFHALKARVLLARREYESAITENEAAIALNPTFAAAHCGLGDSLAYEGHYDEALECFERSLELSPNDPQRWAFYTYGALARIFCKDFEGAIRWAERARGLPNCQYWADAHRTVALAHLGRDEEARGAASALVEDNPLFCLSFVRQKLFYLRRRDQIDLYLEGLVHAGVPEHRGRAEPPPR